MPASGKSTAGVLLAKTVGYGFIDSDLLIQNQQKRLLCEIIEREGALRACKVMRVCPKCDKPTRVAHKITENGTKLTVCKHCGETL